MKNARYQQAAKEARWAVGIAILYVIGWCCSAYLPANQQGLLGFPLWFELACIYTPIVFLVIAYWVIKIAFRDFSLEYEEDKQ